MLKSRGINKKKLIVILGPTACGKTRLAVSLARKFNGEIVSADSRQVYRGMDIGTGKDLPEYGQGKGKIPYHLIDIANPKNKFSLAGYQKMAYRVIDDILARNKVPLLTGGTGLYIQSIVDGYQLPGARPDNKIRQELSAMDEKTRIAYLSKLDPEKAKEIDMQNSRRVIRAIEIALDNPAGSLRPRAIEKTKEPKYHPLLLGVTYPIEVIREKIRHRLQEELKNGLLDEVRRLHENGLSWKRLDELGLEYRYASLFLQGKVSQVEMVEKLAIAIGQFAKRQMTWFKRDHRICWIKDSREAENLIRKFIA